MKTINNYIKEKLVINTSVQSSLFDGLMKAHLFAKKEYNRTKEQQYVYKTKDSEYGVATNTNNYKVGATTEEGDTVLELVPQA